MNHDVILKFASLFQGRTDAYGTEAGGCDRNPGGGVLERHLSGENPIGVYPMVPVPIYGPCTRCEGSGQTRDGYECPKCHGDGDDMSAVLSTEWRVRWGCVDFDIRSDKHPTFDYETEDDAHVAATNLQRVLAALGVTAWIERTRSHGRHVWVFASVPVPAATMRRALLVSCGLAEVSTREVNPKQFSLEEGQLGNYVRLPYPGGEEKPSSRVMLTSFGDTQELSWWVGKAYAERTPPDVLESIAAHYEERPATKVVEEYDGALDELVDMLDANVAAVFRDGPSYGDRSSGLYYVAVGCRNAGLLPGDALAVVRDADLRWGKYSKRPDCEKQLMRTVERAYLRLTFDQRSS